MFSCFTLKASPSSTAKLSSSSFPSRWEKQCKCSSLVQSCQRNNRLGSFETWQLSAWCYRYREPGSILYRQTIENYGGFEIMIKTKTQGTMKKHFHMCNKATGATQSNCFFRRKATTAETLNRISFYLFLCMFSLIILACTIYIPHCILFVYEYLGRAPTLWCNWSQRRAPLLPPALTGVETSQAKRNRVPESFFTSTGRKKSNKWRTSEKSNHHSDECSYLTPILMRKMQHADTA